MNQIQYYFHNLLQFKYNFTLYFILIFGYLKLKGNLIECFPENNEQEILNNSKPINNTSTSIFLFVTIIIIWAFSNDYFLINEEINSVINKLNWDYFFKEPYKTQAMRELEALEEQRKILDEGEEALRKILIEMEKMKKKK